MSQGFAEKFRPAVLISYEVDCDDLVDLRNDANRADEGIGLVDMASPWFTDITTGREPSSWAVARQYIKQGVAGILVPSFAAGADPDRHQNLVLWKWGRDPPHRVKVYDPDSRLPRNDGSWEEGPK